MNTFQQDVDQIEQRIKGTKIRLSEVYEEVDPESDETGSHLTLTFPKGRGEHSVWLTDDELGLLLAHPFEHYYFLPEYRAMVSYKDGVVEATLDASGVNSQSILIAISGRKELTELEQIDGQPRYVLPRQSGTTVVVSIGLASDLHEVIVRGNPYADDRSLTIRIEGLSVSNQEEASHLLESIAHSMLFQIDLLQDSSMRLARDTRRRGAWRNMRKRQPPLPFPSHRYDSAPMALYVYARSAQGMPLLQFLAFYQCLEFYFPRYSRQEALRALTNVLKNPQFNPHRATDVERVLNVAQSGSSRGFVDELSQLKATLQHCITVEELRMFLGENEKRKAHVSDTSIQGAHKIASNLEKADVHTEVAHRIYDIRCRIVHAKSSGASGREDPPLLPFSAEEDALFYDIQIIRFLAQRALIASSTELHVP